MPLGEIETHLKGFNTFRFLFFNDYGSEPNTYNPNPENDNDFRVSDKDFPPF